MLTVFYILQYSLAPHFNENCVIRLHVIECIILFHLVMTLHCYLAIFKDVKVSYQSDARAVHMGLQQL
jgi:hypothetical protein